MNPEHSAYRSRALDPVKPMRANLSYQIIGVAGADDPSLLKEFENEVAQRLEHLESISVSGSGTTVQVDLKITDIEPFDKNNYEPFVFDQVWDSVHAYFHIAGEEVQFELSQCKYST